MMCRHKLVVHLTSVHSPFDVRIFHKEAKTLVSAGFSVTLIAQHDKCETVDGIKIISLPKAKNRIHRMLSLPLRAFIMALRQEAHIYHLHDPELILVGVLLKLMKGKKVIYDAHEDYEEQMLSKPYLPEVLRREIGFLVRIVEHFCSRSFDAIVTATDDILRKFCFHKLAVSVKNFPLLANYSPEMQRMEGEGGEDEIFRLIYVGGLAEIRGISEVVSALEFINSNIQVRLTLCGLFSPADYEFKVRSLEGFKKVDYLGWVDPRDIPMLLEKHKAGVICLHPTTNYLTSLPLKLFEYMAAGLPVIASNFPLWRQIIEGNKCGICVDPLKPKEIARAITRLMADPELRSEMCKNGRKAVWQKYNWEKESRRLVQLYEELLKPGQRLKT